ncbi:MAG: alpha/beta hydrolase [Mycobacterium sp.]
MTADLVDLSQGQATVVLDGIPTRYEVAGSGPPLLMFSPGGFNAVRENWRTHGVYRRTEMLDRLRARFTCITFDKRESGRSGGRFERLTWSGFARQGIALLNHLGIGRAFVMGGCVGCSIALRMTAEHPDRVAAMVLYSPAGGVKYRMKQHERFTAHLAYVAEHGLAGVVDLVEGSTSSFSEDGRVGPWANSIRSDPGFTAGYRSQDADVYQCVVVGMSRLLFDRDTVPGAEPEELLTLQTPALIVPGADDSHAPSAAHYLGECLPSAQFWDMPVGRQTAQSAPARVVDFLSSVAL